MEAVSGSGGFYSRYFHYADSGDPQELEDFMQDDNTSGTLVIPSRKKKELEQVREKFLNGFFTNPETFRRLETLHLEGDDDLTSWTGEEFDLSGCWKLRKLVFNGCTTLTQCPWGSKGAVLQSLKVVSFVDCFFLCVPKNLEFLRRLEVLELVNLSEFLTTLPASLAECTNLKELKISAAPGLTYLPKEYAQFPRLKLLWLIDCIAMTALFKTEPSSSRFWPALRELDYTGSTDLKISSSVTERDGIKIVNDEE